MCDIALHMSVAVYHTCINKVDFMCVEWLECVFLHGVKRGKNMEFNFLKSHSAKPLQVLKRQPREWYAIQLVLLPNISNLSPTLDGEGERKCCACYVQLSE